MNGASEKQRLDKVAGSHSYAAGFNGTLTKYRIRQIDKCIQTLNSQNQVLEIGAGEGAITRHLAGRFDQIVAIEPAAGFFAKLEAEFGAQNSIKLINGLYEDIQLNSQFPLIVAAGVLEHVREPVTFLRKIKSQLAPGGLFLATVPNATSLHRKLGVKMGLIESVHSLSEQDHRVGHYRYYDFATLRSDHEAAGFKNIELSGIMLKPFPNDKMDELSTEFCDALFEVSQELPEWSAEIFVCARN